MFVAIPAAGPGDSRASQIVARFAKRVEATMGTAAIDILPPRTMPNHGWQIIVLIGGRCTQKAQNSPFSRNSSHNFHR